MDKQQILDALAELIELASDSKQKDDADNALPKTERPNLSEKNQKNLVCPFAQPFIQPMKTQGKFENSYPVGAVVHFTAGSSIQGSIHYGIKQNYAFWGIGRDGTIYQTHYLDKWGHHAGSSHHKDLGYGLSSKLLGIEIASAGRLKQIDEQTYESWFGKLLRSHEVRVGPEKDNCQAGAYEAYTKEQEESLTNLLLWLKANNEKTFQLDYVLGHDEIAPNRKNDPGWALSMTMPEFREYLKSLYY